jgi:putative ABC transport system substrate-binding protein
LHSLGYTEGKNVVIEYRFAEGKLDRLPDLATELVRLGVDVIVTSTVPGVSAAKNASNTIPIVSMTADPVAAGLVESLARPGGNVTGLTNLSPDLQGKRLELLKEVVPGMTWVAFLWNRLGAGAPNLSLKTTANALGLQLQSFEVQNTENFDSAFQTMIRKRAQGFLTSPGPIISSHQAQILQLAANNRLPAIYPYSEFVDAGGLMSYNPSYDDLYRRAAIYVDKILKGRKPADLPVEQPMKFEFVINLNAAKQIGLMLPPNVLARADRVIK